VLDTNVVLDWLVFHDPRCASLAAALQLRRLTWVASAAMRDELAAVLPRPQFARWQPDCAEVLSNFDRFATPCAAPRAAAPALNCRDPDDQMFIDLACALRATWLFSRDRALLALARRARAWDVEITTPQDWACVHAEIARTKESGRPKPP
jgi:predicted nucleic acid-binding protein